MTTTRTNPTPSAATAVSVFLLLVVGLLTMACGGARPEVEDPLAEPEGEVVAFDTELVMTEPNGEVVTIEAEALFEQAMGELQREEYAPCARHFDVLWQSLEDASFVIPGLYNAGLCHERLERYPEAAERYMQLIELDGDSDDGLDAYFRLAEADANLSNWERVAEHMTGVLERDDLKHRDRVEARYRAGMALLALRRLSDAESMFKQVVYENRRADRAKLPEKEYFISGSIYGRALVYHAMFEEIQFRLPEEQMKIDMQTKIELGRQAYDLYVKVVRYRNAYWSILSGYMVGKLFEDFYYDTLSAEIPHDLDEASTRLYLEGLREELLPLLDEALKAWQKTSATATRMRMKSEWVDRAEERMLRIREYLADEETWRAEDEALYVWNEELARVRALQAELPEGAEPLELPPPPPLPRARAAAPE